MQPLTVGRRIDVGVTWKYLHVDFAAVDLMFWRTKSVKACLFFEGLNSCDGAGAFYTKNAWNDIWDYCFCSSQFVSFSTKVKKDPLASRWTLKSPRPTLAKRLSSLWLWQSVAAHDFGGCLFSLKGVVFRDEALKLEVSFPKRGSRNKSTPSERRSSSDPFTQLDSMGDWLSFRWSWICLPVCLGKRRLLV